MLKAVYLTSAFIVQFMFAVSLGGIIISLHNEELVLALLFGALYSCVTFMWKEIERDIKELIKEEKHERKKR